MIYTIVQTELAKMFRKWRTYIGFIVIVVLMGIVQTALYYEGKSAAEHVINNYADNFVMLGNLFNGYFIGKILLQALYIHIPFLIVLVGGDLFAGEATAGTYRMIFTRPVTRLQVVTGKYIAGFIYTALFMGFVFLFSVGVSCALFGTGELIMIQDKIYIFAANDVLWRFGLAFLFATLSMVTVISISLFFSSLVANAIGPIISTMAIIIVFLIISHLEFDFVKVIHPYLFTNYLNEWTLFFVDKVDYKEVFKAILVLLGHIVGLYAVTSYIFIKKDILS